MKRGTRTTPPTRAASTWQRRRTRFTETCHHCRTLIEPSLCWSRNLRGTWQYQHLECPTS